MIPAGVTRIIWAISPNEGVRDAILGDFAEEFAAREQREGTAAARRWCWAEALRSLAGTLQHSFPSAAVFVTSIVPAILYGYFIGLLTWITGIVVSLPLVAILTAVVKNAPLARFPEPAGAALAIASLLLATPAALIAGFEAARIGRKAPLWSATLLAVSLASVSLMGLFPLGTLFIRLPWFGAVIIAQLVTALIAGAVLQQSMPYRFDPKIAAKV